MQVAAKPLHAPPQPTRLEPGLGVAVSVTSVPCPKLAAHAAGQLMPAGALVTEPPPVTATSRARGVSLKVAVTAFAASIVTVQVPVPEQRRSSRRRSRSCRASRSA